jgi:hypothetical protein
VSAGGYTLARVAKEMPKELKEIVLSGRERAMVAGFRFYGSHSYKTLSDEQRRSTSASVEGGRNATPPLRQIKTPSRSRDSFIRTEALLLLLTFSMSFLALFPGILRMLLGGSRMFFALRVVILSVLLGRGAMGLGGILVMFRRLIVGVFRHGIPPVSVGVT